LVVVKLTDFRESLLSGPFPESEIMKSIVIIEKEIDLAEVIANYLSDFQIHALICTSPNSIKQEIKNSKPQAVIIDWNSVQPDYSAWVEAIGLFAKNTLCIWTLTDDADVNKQPKLFDKQFCLSKPFELDTLVKKLALES
jgi:DNA-binding response OmpR family regulator